MLRFDGERTPGFKLFLTILVGLALAIPIFSVWLLVYDRQNQSEQASNSITAGWGGPQALAGPVLVIPYSATATETVFQDGRSVTRANPATAAIPVVFLTAQSAPEDAAVADVFDTLLVSVAVARTFSMSTPSSCATTCITLVLMPWPISVPP